MKKQKIKVNETINHDFKGMHLLNPTSMSKLNGGELESDLDRDNLNCKIVKVYLCAYEINCSGKGFTYDCSFTKFSAGCSKGTEFSIKPI